MKNIFSKRNLFCLTSFFIFILVCFTAFLFPINYKNSVAFTSESSNTDAVKVNELWINDLKKFNGDNVNLLLQLISGDNTTGVFNIAKIKEQATQTKKASEIRQTEINAQFNDFSINKTSSQDIILTLGGLEWTVTYLSLDKDNNPILTLWLSNSEQLSGGKFGNQSFTSTGGAYWGYVLSSNAFSSNEDYPDNMYGTSYMRSVVLNNGGDYLTVDGRGNRDINANEKEEGSVFSIFTIPTEGEYNDLTDFIVTPSKVSWQEDQSYVDYFTEDEMSEFTFYNRSNDAWSKTKSDDGFSTLFTNNYATKNNSDKWATDNLWLPSITETGLEGIWDLSGAQTQNVSYSWLRSGWIDDAGKVSTIDSSGGNFGSHDVYVKYGVRPALHLNLNTIVEHTTTERDISLCEFNTLDEQQWNPIKNIIPEITVTDKLFSFQPIKNVDYEIIVPEITGPGIVNIKVVGHDRYKGEKIVELKLTKRDFNIALKDNDLTIEDKTFCNNYITPVFESLKDYGYLAPSGEEKVDENGTPVNLVQDTDYELSYENNFNKGTATITITGINKYIGEITTTFNIIDASILEGTLTLNKNSVEYYYGENILKDIFETLIVDEITLEKDKDYIINYYNELDTETILPTITEIGKYVAVVTGIGNYRDSKSVSLEVTKASLKDNFISLNNGDSYTYTGFSINPDFSVSFNYVLEEEGAEGKTYTFVEGQDFTTKFGENILVSTGGSITISGIGKFKGTASISFKITPKDIASSDIEDGEIEDQNYFVTALTPDFTLTDKSRNEVLVIVSDYTTEYSNNVNVGTATITITGTGNYVGERTKNFEIIPRDINLAIFDNIKNQIFTGEELTPIPTIKDRNNKSLVVDEDFTLMYYNNINITDEAVVTITGKGNYNGNKQLTFVIDPKSIANGVITLNPNTAEFNGSKHTPNVTLTLDGNVIERDADETNVNYEIKYFFNNKEIDEMVNAGIYTIKVLGKNNYGNETSTTFEITKYDLAGTTANSYTETFSYNKLTQVPTITLNFDKLVLENSKDFNISYYKENKQSGSDDVSLVEVKNPTDAGTYRIVLSGINNYKGKFEGLSFIIETISLNDCIVTYNESLNLDDITFDNTAKKAEVTSVKIGEVEIFNVSSDSIVRQYVNITYSRNSVTTSDFTNSGEINISILPASDNITGTYSRNYTIKQKDLFEAKTNGYLKITGLEDKTYNRQKQVLNISIVDENANNYTLLNTNDYSVTVTDDLILANENIDVTITSSATGNYTGTIVENLKIVKAIVDSFTLQSNNGNYNGNVHTIVPIVKAGKLTLSNLESNKEYSYSLTKGENTALEYDLINYGEINVTITLVDTNNFKFKDDLVITLIYTINSVEVGTITLRENSVQYDTNSHKIIIDKVTSKNGLALLTDEYTVKYNGTEIDTYTNAGTIKVEVTGLGNYTGTASVNYTITPRPINSNEIAYYIANEDGTLTSNLISFPNKFMGEYVAPDINIEEGNTNLQIDSDYTFGIYLSSDKTQTNNLYKTDRYLQVGSYQFVVTGMGNYSGVISKTYIVNVANFDETSIDFTIPKNTSFTGNPISIDLSSDDVAVTYTKLGHLPISLEFNTHFKVFTGYIEVTFKAGSVTEIESAKVLTNQNEINNKKDNDNVFYVTNGYFNNTNVGLASVVITAVAGSSYQTGTVVVSQFTINQVELVKEQIEITNLESSYVYTGSNIEPNFIVKSLQTNEILNIETDYTLEYLSDNTNVGEISFKITGKNNYSGILIYENIFSIVTKDIESSMFQISKNETYTGYEQKPTLSGIFNDKSLVDNVDYTITYKRGEEVTSDFTNAGDITIILKGKGNFSGEINHVYKISRLQIETLQLSAEGDVYTGNSLKPDIIVLDNKGNLVTKGFKLQFSRDNIIIEDEEFIDVGAIKISVIISDINNYELKESELFSIFTITKANLSNASVSLDNTSLVYTGLSLKPEVTISLNGKDVPQENYQLTYFFETEQSQTEVDEMINAGSYIIKIKGVGNFEGSLQTNFTITRYDISSSSTILPTDYEKTYVYNGKIQKPTITLGYGSLTLKENEAFTITYRKEHLAGSVVEEPTDAGIYFIILMGMGNFTGTINSLTFEIKPLSFNSEDNTITFVDSNNTDLSDIDNIDYTFNGKEQKISVKSIIINNTEFFDVEEKNILVTYTRNSVATSDFMSAGIIDIRIEADNIDNISGYKTYSYTIKQKEFTNNIKVTGLEDRVYNREKQVFDILLTDEDANNYKLQQNLDYSITFSSDCVLVEKDIIVTFAPLSANYKGQSFTKTFSINKAVIDSFELNETEGFYNKNPHSITATVKANEFEIYDSEEYLEYQLIYKRNGSAVTNLTSVGEIEVTLVLLDTPNFELKQGLVTTLTYTIKKAEIKEVTLQDSITEFNNQDHTIVIDSVTSKNGLTLSTNDYETVYIIGDYQSTNPIYKEACIVTVKVTATDDSNYIGSAITTYTISKMELVESNISYYLADENGNATNTPFDMVVKYKGKKVAPVVSVSFEEGDDYELILNNLNDTGDYLFAIYTLEDYNSTKQNNLFGKDDYLFAGEYVFVVTGKNNFSGEIISNYKVSPADFNSNTIQLTIPSVVDYTGKEIEIDFDSNEVEITYTKQEGEPKLDLTLNIDFQLFSGFVEITYGSDKQIISYRVISESDYNILKDNESENVQVLRIVNGYANNILSGIATFVITGAEPNFEQDTIVLAQFTINRVTLDATITGINETYTYTGNAIVPEITVVSNDTGMKLVEGTDYVIEYSNNINTGYAGFIITAMNNYSGEIERNRAFYIEPKQIDESMFTFSKDKVYNTQEQKPEISAKYNFNIMVENEDYEVVFKRGGEVTSDFINAGNILIVISGKGNYSSEFTKIYVIEKWVIKEVKLSFSERTYNAKDQKPDIEILGINGEQIDSAGYEINYSTEDFISAGQKVISVTVTDNVNYALFTQQVSAVFTINKEDISNLTSTIEDYIYTSLEIKPNFTLMLNNDFVSSDEYSVVSYHDNINAGKGKIVVSSQNINFTGTKEIEFNILPKTIEDSMYSIVEEKTFVYNGNEQTLDFEIRYTLNENYSTLLLRDRDYTILYENNINANSDNSSTVTITGVNNYDGTIIKHFSILKADPIVMVDLPENILFAGDSLLNDNYLILKTGSTAGKLTNSTVEKVILSNPMDWTFIPDDTNNYNNASGKITVPAYYQTKIEFGKVDDLIASADTKVSVKVTFKMDINDSATLDLPSNNYQVIVTRNGFEVSNYEQSGTYNIRVNINNNNYRIVGEDNITFQVKPTTIYSNDESFYAVCESGFDVNVSLYVQVFDSVEDIISILGEENYAKLENIQKLYIVELYSDNGPVTNPDAKIYLKANVNNNYYLLQDANLELQEISNGTVIISTNTYVIETLIPSVNYTQFILFGAGALVAIVILIVIIIAITKVRKKKKSPKLQGEANSNNLQGVDMQNFASQQMPNYQNTYIPSNNPQNVGSQNLNTLIGQVNPNSNNNQTIMPNSQNLNNYNQNVQGVNYNNYNQNANINNANNVNYNYQNQQNNNLNYSTQNNPNVNKNIVQYPQQNMAQKPVAQNTQIQNGNANIYTNNLTKNTVSINPYSYSNNQNGVINQDSTGIQPLSPSAIFGVNSQNNANKNQPSQNGFNQGINKVNPINSVNNQNKPMNSMANNVNNNMINNANVNRPMNTQNYFGNTNAYPNKNVPEKPKSSINPNSVLGNMNNNPPKNN